MRERPTQCPCLDPRFRGGDGGRAENDLREGTNGPYATQSSTFFMRQFQEAIAPIQGSEQPLRVEAPTGPGTGFFLISR